MKSFIKLFFQASVTATKDQTLNLVKHPMSPGHSTNCKSLPCVFPVTVPAHYQNSCLHRQTFCVCSPASVRTSCIWDLLVPSFHYSALLLSPFVCRLCLLMPSLYLVFKGKVFPIIRPLKFSLLFQN